MKLQKIVKCAAAASLGIAVVIVLGGYVWLYSWKWGGVPTEHSSWSADEVHRLHEMDAYLTMQAAQANHLALRQAWLCNENVEENEIPWLVQMALRLYADWESKFAFAPAREALHDFITSGTAQGNVSALAALTLMKGDVLTFKSVAEKAASIELGEFLGMVIYPAAPGTECMPVAQRLELLDWMHSKGVDVTDSIQTHRFMRKAQQSMLYSDDSNGEILNWFLRHGYQLNAADAAGLFLLQADASLPTWQKLIEDAVLSLPPCERDVEGELRTLLQIVVSADNPSPETVRWLLSLGHNPNALPAGADTFASENGEHPRIFRKTPLEACLSGLQYFSMGLSAEEDARLRQKLEVLEILLQYGAVPTEQMKDLLPVNPALKEETLALFQRHGFHLTAGENPYNACCSPE